MSAVFSPKRCLSVCHSRVSLYVLSTFSRSALSLLVCFAVGRSCLLSFLAHTQALTQTRTHTRPHTQNTHTIARTQPHLHAHTHTHANRNIRAERQKLVREQQAIESKVCECVCVCAYMCVYVSECWCGCLCLSLFVLVFACSFLSSSHVRISFILTSPFRHFRQFFLFFLFFWVFDSMIAGQRRVQQDQQTREGRQQGFVFCVCVCVCVSPCRVVRCLLGLCVCCWSTRYQATCFIDASLIIPNSTQHRDRGACGEASRGQPGQIQTEAR